MKLLKWLAVIVLVFTVVYFLGPRPSTPKYTTELPAIPAEGAALDSFVSNQEARFKIKPDNEARILWANDSAKAVTEYAVVYLHGFSASQEEGDPVHYDFAQKFGCNLYLSRLDAHGIDTTEQLVNFTAAGIWQSAKEALCHRQTAGQKSNSDVHLHRGHPGPQTGR